MVLSAMSGLSSKGKAVVQRWCSAAAEGGRLQQGVRAHDGEVAVFIVPIAWGRPKAARSLNPAFATHAQERADVTQT